MDRATQTTRRPVASTRHRQRSPRRTTSGANRAARENRLVVRREMAARVARLNQPINFRVAVHPHTSRRIMTARGTAGRRLQPAELLRVPEAYERLDNSMSSSATRTVCGTRMDPSHVSGRSKWPGWPGIDDGQTPLTGIRRFFILFFEYFSSILFLA